MAVLIESHVLGLHVVTHLLWVGCVRSIGKTQGDARRQQCGPSTVLRHRLVRKELL